MPAAQWNLDTLNTIPLMLGGNVFGWTADRESSFAVLDGFVDGGGSLVDTADYYAAWAPGNVGGESERLIGDWLTLRGRRHELVIATKVGLLEGPSGKGLKPARIIEACDESLQRLRTDVIDIYFAHVDDGETPFEESLAAFDRLIAAGKVRAIGASNFTAARLAEALAVADANGLPRFQIVEPKYNLVMRQDYEGALQNLVVAEGLKAVPFYGLGGGFLTGKYRAREDIAGSPRETWLAPYFAANGTAILAAMDALSQESGLTLPEISMAWLRSKPGILAPIASATSTAQMNALLSGLHRQLRPSQIAMLDAAGRG